MWAPQNFNERKKVPYKSAQSKRGREEGHVVTFYDEFYDEFYVVLWNKETEIVIKCRKLS